MTRAILHCDLNSFYASVEIFLDPTLKGKAVAVCGSVEDRHGIVLAKSDAAKKMGVSTGEAVWQAKEKCPDLIVVPPHYDQYLKFSKLARKIYEDYTDMIEPFGIDECWLDVTGSTRLFGSPEHIGMEIKERMKKEVGLSISVGVSFNKIFAKLGSDMKKPDAMTVISKETFREQIWSLPASDMLGVGRATGKKLYDAGIFTIGDVAQCKPERLKSRLGVNGLLLWRYANGLENSPVSHMNFKAPIKSIGHGITCTKDLRCRDDIWKLFYELSQEVSDKLRDNDLMANGVQITVRDSRLNCKQYQGKLICATQSIKDIAFKAMELFDDNHNFIYSIRSLTVRAIYLTTTHEPVQLSLDYDMKKAERNEKIEKEMKNIRKRYGSRAITFGSLLHIEQEFLPGSYNNGLTMPSGIQR